MVPTKSCKRATRGKKGADRAKIERFQARRAPDASQRWKGAWQADAPEQFFHRIWFGPTWPVVFLAARGGSAKPASWRERWPAPRGSSAVPPVGVYDLEIIILQIV